LTTCGASESVQLAVLQKKLLVFPLKKRKGKKCEYKIVCCFFQNGFHEGQQNLYPNENRSSERERERE
jgi:hypothetical protein